MRAATGMGEPATVEGSRFATAALLAAAVAFGASVWFGRPLVFAAALVAGFVVVAVFLRPVLGLYAMLWLLPLEAAGRVVQSQPAFTWAKVALMLCVLGLVGRALLSDERFEAPPHTWALAGFGAAGLAASLVGGFGMDVETLKNLSAVVSNIAMVLVAYQLLRTRRSLEHASLAVILGSLPVIAIGLYEVVTKQAVLPNPMIDERFWAPGATDIFRITSTFYDPNVLGRYLMFAFLFTLCALWLPGLKKFLPLLLVVLGVQLYCLVNTFSRAAFVSVAVVGVPFLIAVFVRRWRLAGLVIGSVLAVALAWSVSPLLNILLARFSDPTAGGRVGIAFASIPVIARSPLLGYGREHVPQALATTVGTQIDPHNLYLEILLAVGVIGLLMLLAFALPTIRDSVHLWRAGDPFGRLIVVPLAGVLVFGLSLQGMDGYELWIPFALALPVLRLAGEERAQRARGAPASELMAGQL